MAEILSYKCPCCGGSITFDTAAQKLKCPYCDTEFEKDVLDSYEAELQSEESEEKEDWEQEENKWEEGEQEGLFTFVCNSCGGEIVGDENLGSTKCPFCDSPVILKGRFEGDFKPDYVIPFKLDKKAAKEKFKAHLTGKRLLPKVFKDENHIDEIKGMYVPFWLFDADVAARLRYRGTRLRTWSDSDYNYTETRHYSIIRGGNIGFCNVPVDGSSKMADDLMESVEPFDFRDAVSFDTAYMAGYFADKYDVTSEESRQRARERIKRTTEDIFRETIHGFASVYPEGGNVNIEGGRIKYVLYPVWLLNTTWNNERYHFAMNGQTGKFVGNLPMDKGAFMKYFALFGAIGFSAALALLLMFYYLL